MAAYFVDGHAQVTIIYRDQATGMMLRIRPDYLRAFGCIDLKRARSIQASKLGWQCVEYGYDLQEVMYIDGMIEAKRLYNAGKLPVHGDIDKSWLKTWAADEDNMFRFVFQRSVKPYIFCVKFFDGEIRNNARALVSEGIHKYQRAIERYGTSEWPAGSPLPEEFSIYHFPRRTFDR